MVHLNILATYFYGQTIVTGMENISVSIGTVVSIKNYSDNGISYNERIIQDVEDKDTLTIRFTNKKYSNNNFLKAKTKTLGKVKKKSRTVYKTPQPQKIKFVSKTFPNGSSFSLSPGNQIMVFSVDFQWKVISLYERFNFNIVYIPESSNEFFRKENILFYHYFSNIFLRGPPISYT